MTALVAPLLVSASPVLLVLLVLASLTIVFIYMKRRNALLEQKLSQAKEEKEKEIALAIVRTQEEERNKIATDLHDSVGAELSLLKLKLSRYSYYLKNNLIIKSENFSEDVKQLDETIENVRCVCKDLYPETLRKKGLLYACRYFACRMSKGRNIRLKFSGEVAEQEIILSDEARRSVFRIFQEIMHNLIKHSRCQKLEVKIYMNRNTGFLKFRLRHNGRSFNNSDALKAIDAGSGHGLMNISNRLKVLGGKISYQRKGTNSFVFVSLPMTDGMSGTKLITMQNRGVTIEPELKIVFSKSALPPKTRQPKLERRQRSV